MLKKVFSLLRCHSVLLVLVAFVVHNASMAQDLQLKLPDGVRKYMDSRTAVVGWVDLSQLDVAALGQFRGKMTGAEESTESQKAVVSALTQTGVTRVYWISDTAGLVSGPRAVFVPVPPEKKDAVAAILKALAVEIFGGNDKAIVIVNDDVILAGDQAAVDFLLSERRGTVNDDFLKALDRVQDPHGIVVATPVHVMLPIVAVLPKLVNGDAERVAQASEYLVNLRTFTLSGQLPPSEVTVRISTKSKATAEGLTSMVNEWMTGQVKEKADILKLTAGDEDVTLKLKSVDESLEALTVFQQLATGDAKPQSMNSLKQIALGLHNFYDAFGCLPPQAVSSDDGKRLLSWRVLILPYIDQAQLYSEFHLDEPWDSEHNQKLIAKMPATYRSVPVQGVQGDPGKTRFVAPLTKDSVFGRSGPGTQFKEITDGTSNTLMVVEADVDKAVIWTKPEDIVIDDKDPISSILNPETPSFAACHCDGYVRLVSRNVTAETLRAFLSMNGGEVISWDEVDK
ncbi:MAG: DUF1559 domain-containing protein [Planctomyces sp.]|nr:DUF1559 domain-containing protein [Planctomyces sp.]